MRTKTIRLKRPRDPLGIHILRELARRQNPQKYHCRIGKITEKQVKNGNANR